MPSAGIVSLRSVSMPSVKFTDMTQGMPNSRDRMPRWLSGAPCRVISPAMPLASAGAMKVVVPPREIPIVLPISPLITSSITASGESSQRETPSAGVACS